MSILKVKMNKYTLRLFSGIILLSLFPLSWLLYPYIINANLSTCTFKIITRKPCPFCGLTRAFACFMRNDWHAASEFHPLWWIAVLLIFTAGIILIIDGINKTDYSYAIKQKLAPFKKFFIAGIFLFSIIRIIFLS